MDGKIVTYAHDTCLVFTVNSWISVEHKAIIEHKKKYITLIQGS